jgi:hypothetical protein
MNGILLAVVVLLIVACGDNPRPASMGDLT